MPKQKNWGYLPKEKPIRAIRCDAKRHGNKPTRSNRGAAVTIFDKNCHL